MFELEKFIEIRRKEPKINLQSSYFLITKKILETNDADKILNDYKCTLKEDRIYIDLPLPLPVTTLTLLNASQKRDVYRLVSRHLTIDKIFFTNAKIQHGLYPAHYTEEYEYQHNDRLSYKIKVHLYLDINNNFCYMQATKFTIEANKLIGSVEIKNLEDTNILENSKIAGELFGRIIQKRHTLLNKLVESSNQTENELDLLCYKYMLDKTDSNFTLLKATSNKFIGIINQINLYADGVLDQRGKIAQIILNEFEQNKKRSKQKVNLIKPSEGSELHENPNESLDEFEVVNKLPKKIDKQKRLQLIAKLKELYSILSDSSNMNNTDIHFIITKLEALSEAQSIILQLDFTQHEENNVNQEDQKIITLANEICFGKLCSSSYQHATQIKNTILEKFKEYCCNGEIKNVKLLYKHVKNELNIALLKTIMDEIFSFTNCNLAINTDQTNLEQENNLVKIIKFFYEKVTYYRINFLEIMGRPIPRTYEHVIYNVHYRINCYNLFSCILHNKTLLFRTLMDCGAQANACGLLASIVDPVSNKDTHLYGLSLIKSCLLFDCIIQPIFVEELFKRGAFLKNQESFLGVLNHKQFSAHSNAHSKKMKHKKPNQLQFVRVNTIPALNYCAHYQSLGTHLENIKNIQTYMIFLELFFNNENYTEIDLMMYFISLASTKYFSENVILHDNSDSILKEKIIISNNKLNLSACKLVQEEIRYFTFVYTRLPDLCPKFNLMLDIILDKVKLKILEIASNSSDQLDKLIITACTQADSINYSDPNYSLEQIKDLINLKLSLFKVALLFISFKKEIYQEDFILIKNINLKRIIALDELSKRSSKEELDKIYQSINIIKHTTANMIEHFSSLKSKKILILEQNKNGSNNLPIHTCLPPPGSIIKNGITVVPKM